MKGSKGISSIMLRDHARIAQLLDKVDKDIGQKPKKLLTAFQDFVWNLEKHFFIEEKIVLIDYNPYNDEDSASISNIQKEHEVILGTLKKLEENLIKNKKVDLSELKKVLLKHRDFENEVLYPLLDLEMNKTQKKIVVEKIKAYYKW